MIDLARFFLQQGQIQGGRVVITGDDAHHLTRVLRLRSGDEIEGVDEGGQVYRIRLESIGNEVLGLVEETLDYQQESPVEITLFQGLAKGDKMDFVIQKAVELGVREVVPFTSRFTVVKLEEKKAKSRQARWERIAHEAAKQSGRTRLPVIGDLHDFAQLRATVKERSAQDELVILAYEGEKQQGIGKLEKQTSEVSVIVGPEGGFAPDEVEALASAGARVCTLGPRILRTETAGLVLLSIIGYKWGDLA